MASAVRQVKIMVARKPWIILLKGNKSIKKIPAWPDFSMLCAGLSDNALVEHCIRNFQETCNIGSFYIVDESALVFSIFNARLMNADHDFVKTVVDFFHRPEEFHGVL